MQTLHTPLPMTVSYGGKAYRLRPWFDRVLEVFSVNARADLDDDEKREHALWLLVASRLPKAPADRDRLWEAIVNKIIQPRPSKVKGPKVFDFVQDAPYIYAAFRQAYRVDLYREHGRLHWWAFLALFQALPEDTRMREIISIRSRPIPRANGHNSSQIAALMQAKLAVQLQVDPAERDQAWRHGLHQMMQALRARARSGGDGGG